MSDAGSECLPVAISDKETIVRALKTPAHFDERKKRLKPAAFRPPPSESGISVMRQLIGDSQCKQKALEICGGSYRGLAVILASNIREVGSTVEDSRSEWFGHADLDHGIMIPANDPPAPEVLGRLLERLRGLVQRSIFMDDGEASSPSWKGKTLAL